MMLLTCVAGVLGISTGPAVAETLIGTVNVGNRSFVVEYDSSFSIAPTDVRILTGVTRGQSLVALDVRPATGGIYAVGVAGVEAQLYLIDLEARTATAVGAPFGGLVEGAGVKYGLDFNPAIDRVRFVSSRGQNIVFNPETGAATVATNLAYAAGDPNASAIPDVADIAYDNNVAGTAATQQRGIDTNLDVLVTVANNAGTLGTIGHLGVDATGVGGFDVSGETGVAYAVMTARGGGFLGRLGLVTPKLYKINLTTGAASVAGPQPLGILPLQSLTVVPAELPVPATP